MVEDRIEDLDTVTCSIFQIYFYDSLFSPNKQSKIQNKTKQKTIETLLHELCVLNNQEQNETVIHEYADERDITTT